MKGKKMLESNDAQILKHIFCTQIKYKSSKKANIFSQIKNLSNRTTHIFSQIKYQSNNETGFFIKSNENNKKKNHENLVKLAQFGKLYQIWFK